MCISLGNTPNFLPVFWGTALARAVAAPLNPAYKVEENRFYLEDSDARLLVLDEDAPAGTQTLRERVSLLARVSRRGHTCLIMRDCP